MRQKQTLIFDFDGTLINSMQRLTELAATVMAKHYRLALATGRQRYRETSGLPFFEQLNTLYPKELEKNKIAAADFEEQKVQTYFSEEPYPDTMATLTQFKQRGYKIAISSNSADHLVQRLLQKLKLPHDLAFGYKQNFDKGEPHFSAIAKEWNLEKNNMVFIGDSLKDGEKASRYGIRFIGKTGTFSRKEFQEKFPEIVCIAELAELERLFP